MTARVITLWRVDLTSLATFMSTMRFLLTIVSILKAIKSSFKGHMINRSLHSWSFQMKFMKRAFGSFHKFHMMRSKRALNGKFSQFYFLRFLDVAIFNLLSRYSFCEIQLFNATIKTLALPSSDVMSRFLHVT